MLQMCQKITLCFLILWGTVAKGALLDKVENGYLREKLVACIQKTEGPIEELSNRLKNHQTLWTEIRDAGYPNDGCFEQRDTFLRKVLQDNLSFEEVDPEAFESLPQDESFACEQFKNQCNSIINATEAIIKELTGVPDFIVSSGLKLDTERDHPLVSRIDLPGSPIRNIARELLSDDGSPWQENITVKSKTFKNDMTFRTFVQKNNVLIQAFQLFWGDNIQVPMDALFEELAGEKCRRPFTFSPFSLAGKDH
jgi:hypothetical protein